eukprot:CAMPEP_0113327776 /NCGR_PEP_ID=MMETSP0010_2-20120614/19539_1 /TAXON_ID=216773 ORGANISM="Corethron hystrix, Strain 308" /NCGR_SAMPLE_ID=MMETSP0010_2 /ASSEMBLY_ACC=CAM_ASM_000155 /LENGTH=558 /DNA_ID=CAMNT_0000188805 /DNA_START=147 /DNA_END=1823 /DNA_ORIENTATION=+ /assembly_acc=CAM_ASM_000155
MFLPRRSTFTQLERMLSSITLLCSYSVLVKSEQPIFQGIGAATVNATITNGSFVNIKRARARTIDESVRWSYKDEIPGEALWDLFGHAVAMDNIGDHIVVGAPSNDGKGAKYAESGHVRVLAFKNGKWKQLGKDIDGESGNDYFGYSVDVNGDGTRIVVGAPHYDEAGFDDYYSFGTGNVRIFEYDSTEKEWVQLGLSLTGLEEMHYFGSSVSMSFDGNRIVVGASGAAEGFVSVYEYNETEGNFRQLGNKIDGKIEKRYDNFKRLSVAISGDGNRIVVGDRYYDRGPDVDNADGADADTDDGVTDDGVTDDGVTDDYFNEFDDYFYQNYGQVRVYELGRNAAWTEVGESLEAEDIADEYGTQVAINSDGSIVVVGGTENRGEQNQTSTGHVRVFEYDDEAISWVQLGADIDGKYSGERFGGKLAVTNDGKSIAVGSIGYDEKAYVFKYSEQDAAWIQQGLGLGEVENACSTVAMNGDGKKVALGCTGIDTVVEDDIYQFNNDSGGVRVYTQMNKCSLKNIKALEKKMEKIQKKYDEDMRKAQSKYDKKERKCGKEEE